MHTDLYAGTPARLVYEPGTIRIEAYKDGRQWAEDSASTPGAPYGIELVAENGSLEADGSDAAIISAYVVDEEGNRCLHETGPLCHFSCNEAGELITTNSLRADLFMKRTGEDIRFWGGKCQALYRSLESGGDLIVQAQAEGLRSASITIRRFPSSYLQVKDADPGYVTHWRISRRIPGCMDDETIIREHQIERYLPVDTGGTPYVAEPVKGYLGAEADTGAVMNYAYYNQVVIPPLGEKGDKILALFFEGLDAAATVYITKGKTMVKKANRGPSPWSGHYRPEFIVPCDEFSPGDLVEIWVMMHDCGRVHGIGWPVCWIYTTPENICWREKRQEQEHTYHKYADPRH